MFFGDWVSAFWVDIIRKKEKRLKKSKLESLESSIIRRKKSKLSKKIKS